MTQTSLDQFQACQTYSYKGWVYLSLLAISAPGGVTGSYHRGTTTLLRDTRGQSRISPKDLTLIVIGELEHPSDKQHIAVIAAEAGNSDP